MKGHFGPVRWLFVALALRHAMLHHALVARDVFVRADRVQRQLEHHLATRRDGADVSARPRHDTHP
eukprot:2527101-Rhodomonas_salina.1